MDIKRKLEVAQQAIQSISTHDDEDLAVRNAALDRIVALVEAEKAAAAQRVAERIAAHMGAAQG